MAFFLLTALILERIVLGWGGGSFARRHSLRILRITSLLKGFWSVR